jgi:MFS family permease
VPLLIGLGGATLGIAEIALGGTSSFGIALLAMFFCGAGGIAMAATANTLVQLLVPDHLRGRVMSVYTTVFAGSTPFGGLLTGAVASAFSAATALVFAGGLSLVTGVTAIAAIRGRTISARRGRTVRSAPALETVEAGASDLTRVRPR